MTCYSCPKSNLIPEIQVLYVLNKARRKFKGSFVNNTTMDLHFLKNINTRKQVQKGGLVILYIKSLFNKLG